MRKSEGRSPESKTEKSEKPERKPGKGERAWRLARDFNIIGAVALGGLAIVAPVGAGVLAVGAGINAAQAGGYEALRRRSAKKSGLKKKT